MSLTNKKNIHLAMAVFLAHDDYDYDARENSISATSLLKSVRQIILSDRATKVDKAKDVQDFIPASLGTAVHDAIENAWVYGYAKALRRLGYNENTIKRFKINPAPADLTEDTIPVYIEQRKEKLIDGYYVTGKFDFIGDGELVDHKTTGVFSFISKSNDEKYKLQGSIYRWLNQDIITEDSMIINFFFTDWSALRAQIEKNNGYPQERTLAYKIPLLSVPETEKYIKDKLQSISANLSTPEEELPLCTAEDLWQKDPTYKYYKNPALTTKSTKNFNNFAEAQTRLLKDGSVGVIKTVHAKARHCLYCSGAAMCSQARQLILDGSLDMEI